MKLILEVKEVHVHIHINGSDAEALAKLKDLTTKVDTDTASMQAAVDETKGTQ